MYFLRYNIIILAMCERGWVLYDNYCYYFSNATNSWSGARNSCQSLGADLATIKTSHEAAFVASKISPRYWIGASDISVEGISN